MRQKTFKHYLLTFGMVFVFMLILEIISHSKGIYLLSGSLEPAEDSVWANTFSIFLYKDKEFVIGNYLIDILSLLIFPTLIAAIFFLIDFITGKIRKNRKVTPEVDKRLFEEFVEAIGSKLNKTHKFNAEDFRHFRENTKMQDCLKKLYEIYKYGEKEENNYHLVLRKFEKNTKEREAIEYLVAFTETKRKEAVAEELKKREKEEGSR